MESAPSPRPFSTAGGPPPKAALRMESCGINGPQHHRRQDDFSQRGVSHFSSTAVTVMQELTGPKAAEVDWYFGWGLPETAGAAVPRLRTNAELFGPE